ncbi:hypothetical protein PG984_012911 [Apiospora sp. TS-2023a]
MSSVIFTIDTLKPSPDYQETGAFPVLLVGGLAIGLIPFLVKYGKWAVSAAAFLLEGGLVRQARWEMDLLCVTFQELKRETGCRSLSYPQFLDKARGGAGDVQQQQQQEMVQRIQGTFEIWTTARFLGPTVWCQIDLDEFMGKFREHSCSSLDNLYSGRYHALVISAFVHGGMKHLLSCIVSIAFLLSRAFGYGLTLRSVVLLAAGSQVASELATLGQQWLALRASPDPEDPDDPEYVTVEKEIAYAIRKTQSIGSSGVCFGLAAALAYLCPEDKLLRYIFFVLYTPSWLVVPLWPFAPLRLAIPLLLWAKASKVSRQDLRRAYREGLEAMRAGIAPTPDVDHAAHLGGAVFGVIFALVKLTLG